MNGKKNVCFSKKAIQKNSCAMSFNEKLWVLASNIIDN